jgi:hypothetical protein
MLRQGFSFAIFGKSRSKKASEAPPTWAQPHCQLEGSPKHSSS